MNLPDNWQSRLFPPQPINKNLCICCKQPFTTENVFTQAGWREVAISQMCEACSDNLFEDEEE